MDRKRGIGKDGDLPWPKLKGDMKFFRELTTCPDRTAVEKRWGLKADESADVQTWEDVSAMLKFAHPLPVATDKRRNGVVMGRKTWDSLPENFRPLPDRFNRTLSRTNPTSGDTHPDIRWWSSLQHALASFDLIDEVMEAHVSGNPEGMAYSIPDKFVIGGGELFAQALSHPDCARLYITEIDAEFPCDTFFPETPDFRPALSSPWVEENGIRYRFRRYDRVSS